ncbi:MAG: acyltransferase [Hahellaceae bacterium]|nr:acyltransferase [Hahellaceae bacterium]
MSKHISPGHLSYRADIDGLRAIAVSAVVLFHVFPTALPGGFAGVDIFFVISGYLITSIIAREILGGTFTFRRFYERRIRRIFPALLLVLSCTLLAGWALLLPGEFRQLGKHILGGTLFTSNLVLWLESGYFDSSSLTKPLLHLWSLGIEEQFYIFWPIILIALTRLHLSLVMVASLLLLASFLPNIVLVNSDPTSTFYLPFTRFWELMAGALLACLEATQSLKTLSIRKQLSHLDTPLFRNAIALSGLTFIVTGMLLLEEGMAFPGWWATLPVLGSFLLIAAGPSTIIGSWLLSNRVMTTIGLISYPLYLWHWPIITFARLVYGKLPPLSVRLALVVVMFGLAWCTYKHLENRIKIYSKSKHWDRRIIQGLLALSLLLSVLGYAAWQSKISSRLDHLSSLSQATKDWNYPGDTETSDTTPGPNGVLFIGDSYVQQIYPRIKWLREVQRDAIKPVTFITSVGCAPIPGLSRQTRPECLTKISEAYRLAINSPDFETVVIGGSWLGMIGRGDYSDANALNPEKILNFNDNGTLLMALNRLFSEIEKIKKSGKSVHIILNTPSDDTMAPTFVTETRIQSGRPLAPTKRISRKQHEEKVAAINPQLVQLAKHHQVPFIDPAEWICNESDCFFSSPEGWPYLKDESHYRAQFVRCRVTSFDHLIRLTDAELPECTLAAQ